MTERYLLDDLETADMLEIDGLHAFDFQLDEALLDQADAAAEAGEPFASEAVVVRIQAREGREERHWAFSYNAIMEAEQADADSWLIEGRHRLRCFSAIGAVGEDD
ncbi:DUF5629 family protein [Stutzerimonas azotifigens]|uniref:DUF5629 family protein n=1 Tax=Stutzerimonas azotifigens TaxID=291995 RepID=UPI0003F590F2|nr:DUF5629 family protein [Stutzerimonas azotifigens]